MSSASDIRNFNNLFNEYYSRFVRFAMEYLKNQPVAEDFVSEAFLFTGKTEKTFCGYQCAGLYFDHCKKQMH